jgi:hypothetical protein
MANHACERWRGQRQVVADASARGCLIYWFRPIPVHQPADKTPYICCELVFHRSYQGSEKKMLRYLLTTLDTIQCDAPTNNPKFNCVSEESDFL